MFNKNRGFTLIELLVVISIIGLLSSVVLASLNTARIKARDSKRLSDMRQIQLVLELYYDKNGFYPGTTVTYGESETTVTSGNNCGGWDTSGVDLNNDGNKFIDPLKDSGLIPSVPVDPINTVTTTCSGHHYKYFRYPAGYDVNGAGTPGGECDASRGDFYVLLIQDLEGVATGGTHPNSPGWSCNGVSWGGEWRTGKYTN